MSRGEREKGRKGEREKEGRKGEGRKGEREKGRPSPYHERRHRCVFPIPPFGNGIGTVVQYVILSGAPSARSRRICGLGLFRSSHRSFDFAPVGASLRMTSGGAVRMLEMSVLVGSTFRESIGTASASRRIIQPFPIDSDSDSDGYSVPPPCGGSFSFSPLYPFSRSDVGGEGDRGSGIQHPASSIEYRVGGTQADSFLHFRDRDQGRKESFVSSWPDDP